MSDNIKKFLKYSISFILVILSVYLVSIGIDYNELWIAIISANYIWVIVPIPIMLLSHLFRAMRWRTILKPFMQPKSLFNLFSAVMVGYAINNILPRGGEFVRPYVYAKRENVSYTSVFATIIVERVIDVITLLILFAISFLLLKDKIISALPPNIHPENFFYITAPLITIIILSLYRPFFETVLKLFIKPFSEKLHNIILDKFNKFRKGLGIIKKPGEYARILIESTAIWICYALPMYIMFYSFNFTEKYGLGLDDALLLLIIVGVGVTIAPTPGAIGVYHWLILTAMVSLYKIEKEYALAYATVTHGINFLVQIIFGGLFILRERITKIPTNELAGTDE